MRSLLTPRQYLDYPWSCYGVQLAGLTNFAFLIDGLLLALNPGRPGLLVGWILATKLVKLLPHFCRHPHDLVFFPLYVAWAYYHGLFIKLRALLTLGNIEWTGRNLDFRAEKAKGSSTTPPVPETKCQDMPSETFSPLTEVDPNTPLVRRKGHREVVDDN